ncbi:hypothetical protein [Geomesophilobacter sediminis]|uniref:Lipoprotein n=1 Tax=Geomesophilobacter sediminis TaxID=2798584 RepID=A0A8J7LXR0_9BACT|nr:hypothetical protein [Geomesophilobacter sediminis]MBJ6723541.1 hypothetical protein [Geomesophilobacter sediminis]
MNRIVLVLMLALLFQGCGQSNVSAPAAATTRDTGSTTGSEWSTQVPVDTAAFVELFKNSDCADLRNRLFLIDGALVLHDRSGNSCPDNDYQLTLFDGSPSIRLEDLADSIAGPTWLVSTPDHLQMFQTIQANLDKADLGLGTGHTVVQVPMQ